MKSGGRAAAAMEVLGTIETRHRPVGEALKDWGLAHRFAGSGDRAAIGNMVYDALRWRASNAWIMNAETPRALVLATMVRRWGVGVEALRQAFADDPHAPEPLTEAEAARLTTADGAEAPEPVRADIPEWLADRFRQVFGPDWVEEGAALALRPPLDLRVNTLKADRAKVMKALARFGTTEAGVAPTGLRIAATDGDRRHPNVQVEPAFQKGWFEVQDEGSQIAAALVAAKAGEQVLDLCAGAGGKTLAMAAAMENKGQVLATDSDRARLAPIFDRLKRAGTRNVQVRPAGSDLLDLQGTMDAVLIDAPCTGSGTWRRRPDAKWKLTERALAQRVEEQKALLASATRYVKPGGRLVYVTCSLLPDENETQIASFLAADGAFRGMPPAEAIAAAGLPGDLAGAAYLGDTGMTLTPRRADTDGFFVAVMRRA